MRFKNLKINKKMVTLCKKGGIVYSLNEELKAVSDDDLSKLFIYLKSISISGGHGDTLLILDDKLQEAIQAINNLINNNVASASSVEQGKKQTQEESTQPEQNIANDSAIDDSNIILEADKKIQRFFKDFDGCEIQYSYRFKNELLYNLLNGSEKKALKYLYDYLYLSDNIYKDDIISKSKSVEFADILNSLKQVKNCKRCNTRLEIIYGPKGSGKTTYIQSIYSDADTIIADASVECSDLLTKYIFDKNGIPHAVKQPLLLAMEEGKPIVVEEINHYRTDVLEFLQAFTDNKNKFTYILDGEKKTCEIKPGFKIIASMNLFINGRIVALPEPLCDRAVITELKYNPKLIWNK